MVAVGWDAAAYRPLLGTGIDLEVAGVLSGCCCCRSRCSCRAATISWGGCSCGRCEWPALLALRGGPDKAGAGVAGPAGWPTPAARGLLVLPACGPPAAPKVPSACRMNKPIEPSFFFVVGIILRRIDSLARAQNKRSDLEVDDWRRASCGDCLLVYVQRRCDSANASWRGQAPTTKHMPAA